MSQDQDVNKPLKTKEHHPRLPEYAIVPGKGKGRILSYDGNGFFTLLMPDNSELLTHRRNMKFVSTRKYPKKPKHAIVPNKGKGRVKSYDGDGYFSIRVDNKQVLVHRKHLQFID